MRGETKTVKLRGLYWPELLSPLGWDRSSKGRALREDLARVMGGWVHPSGAAIVQFVGGGVQLTTWLHGVLIMAVSGDPHTDILDVIDRMSEILSGEVVMDWARDQSAVLQLAAQLKAWSLLRREIGEARAKLRGEHRYVWAVEVKP